MKYEIENFPSPAQKLCDAIVILSQSRKSATRMENKGDTYAIKI